MKITRILALALVAAAATWAQPNNAQPIGETNPFAAMTGNRFHGTWVGTALGPTPFSMTLGASGSFISQTGLGRAYTLMDNEFAPTTGSWRRSGPRSLDLTGVRYIFRGDGTLASAERVRATLSFGEDFNTMAGEFWLEEFVCEDVDGVGPFAVLPSCPDVQTATADVVRGPIPVFVKRLEIQSGAP